MIKLAHISDIHLSNVPQTLLGMWTGKRFLGGLNMLIFRRKELRNSYFPRLIQEIQKQQPDLLLVTGDMTTTALPKEFSQAHEIMLPFINENKLRSIPGNHDVYTWLSEKSRRYESYFSDCHGESLEDSSYPHVTLLKDEIAIIALNTCVPTGLSGSWGKIDDEQMLRFEQALKKYATHFRVILLHHFLQDKHGSVGLPRRGLRSREKLIDIIKKHGAELILHGHEHACYHYEISGLNKNVPVFCVGPATRHSTIAKKQGGYQMYEIKKKELHKVDRFHFDPTQGIFHQVNIL